MYDDDNDGFAPTPADEQRTLDNIYDGNKADPLPPPPKGKFFSYDFGVAAVEQYASRLFTEAGIDTAGQERLKDQARRLPEDLPDGLKATIMEGVAKNRLADARVLDDPDGDETALAQRIAASNTEARDRLVAQYGAADAEELLARAAKFVRSHPPLAAALRERGLGSRVDIVEQLVAHVFSKGYR